MKTFKPHPISTKYIHSYKECLEYALANAQTIKQYKSNVSAHLKKTQAEMLCVLSSLLICHHFGKTVLSTLLIRQTDRQTDRHCTTYSIIVSMFSKNHGPWLSFSRWPILLYLCFLIVESCPQGEFYNPADGDCVTECPCGTYGDVYSYPSRCRNGM